MRYPIFLPSLPTDPCILNLNLTSHQLSKPHISPRSRYSPVVILIQMEVLVHFAQAHETFRKPEIEAVAELGGFEIQFTEYSLNV